MGLSPCSGISSFVALITTRNLPSCQPCPDRVGFERKRTIMASERVNLTGARETLLMTLYGKALESRLPRSLLEDHFADEAVRNIDYDFSRLKVDDNLGIGLAIRAKTLDVCVQ